MSGFVACPGMGPGFVVVLLVFLVASVGRSCVGWWVRGDTDRTDHDEDIRSGGSGFDPGGSRSGHRIRLPWESHIQVSWWIKQSSKPNIQVGWWIKHTGKSNIHRWFDESSIQVNQIYRWVIMIRVGDSRIWVNQIYRWVDESSIRWFDESRILDLLVNRIYRWTNKTFPWIKMQTNQTCI